jgi:ribonuclease R
VEMLTIDGHALPKSGGGHRGRGNPVRRKEKSSKRKTDKVKRKVKRQR